MVASNFYEVCIFRSAVYQLIFLFAKSTFSPDPADPYTLTDQTRRLGLVVCRGTQVSLISPVDGMEEIANPFIESMGDEEPEVVEG